MVVLSNLYDLNQLHETVRDATNRVLSSKYKRDYSGDDKSLLLDAAYSCLVFFAHFYPVPFQDKYYVIVGCLVIAGLIHLYLLVDGMTKEPADMTFREFGVSVVTEVVDGAPESTIRFSTGGVLNLKLADYFALGPSFEAKKFKDTLLDAAAAAAQRTPAAPAPAKDKAA